jgi:amino acid adenylation domain-containing protein/non-ribosomal peptide synthase protein (TIGR01720 family)
MVVGLLGVLKAGGAYVPLDPGYPVERVKYMLADAGVGVVLTQERLVGMLAEQAGLKVVCLDSGWEEIGQQSGEAVKSGVRAENLAYVIYTSGSTGKPKGAMNTHRGLTNRLLWMQDRYQLNERDRVLQKTPFSFDVSVWEFFWPLMSGACLVVAAPGGHQDSGYLVELIKAEKITTLHFVPSMLQQFLQEEGVGECRSLRRVICSGEALSYELQERFFERVSNTELHNLYGPTEAAIDVTAWECERESQRPIVPIGRPIANIEIHILDEHLQRVPVGVSGELHIGGVGVGRGYWQRPELTAEKFIANPWRGVGGGRLYKTGDLARYLRDGAIEYLGRLDHQVKVRGLRIELGEIEAALTEHPEVAEAVVVARADERGDQQLVAYVVAAAGVELQVPELRRGLKEKLPEYMVPAAFVTLEELPLTPNGKLDRQALPAPERGRAAVGRAYVAARTAVEEIVVGIWREVLRVDQVGVRDNFFELGGHSLLATQVASRLRSAFHIQLPLRAIFEASTIEELAQRIEKLLQSGLRTQTTPIVRIARTGKLPLSFAQQRLWFLDQLEPNSSRYNIFGAGHLKGALNVDALKYSVNEIVRRHEALRTTFALVDGEPVQIIAGVLDLGLPVIDLSGPQERQAAEVQRAIDAEAQRPFDLAAGPLFRASVIRLASDEHILLLAMHHIVSDGWSLGVLMKELVTFYKAHSDPTAPLPDELKIQYADFARWQREWLTEDVLNEQLVFWKDQLQAVPVLDLPTDRPRPPVQTINGSYRRQILPRALAASISSLSQSAGVTVYMTLLAAFQVLLSRYTNQEDIAVGSPVAGRNRAETEDLIGYFVNTLVMRTDLSGNPSFRDVLGRVRDVALGAYTHQDVPFERLVDGLKVERDLSRTPLFQVMFILQNAPSEVVELPGLTIRPMEYELGTAKFDLSLLMMDQPEGLLCHLEYNSDLFDAETVERMLKNFQILLEGAINNADTPIAELPILSETERHTILSVWNDTAHVSEVKERIHEMFEQQAHLIPDALAVTSGANTLTYGELNCLANCLAHRLQRFGLQPDSLVAVMLEKSADLVVALLAILKAGAAYVPLDPEYPTDRLAFMIADSDASVLLTEQRMLDRLGATDIEVLCLDRDWAEISRESSSNLKVPVEPHHLAYMIYTSGSTGTPKGVEIEHAGLLNLVEWHRQAYKITHQDRATLIASPSFDASVWELWPYLASGASVHIPDEDTRMSTPKLLEWLTSSGITISFLPTPLAETMLADELPLQMPLRALLTGGDRLHQVRARPLPFTLVNHYGPTENTVVATCCEVDPLKPNAIAPPIGRPIPNTQVYLLDKFLQPVPIGVAGEIFIGGDSLARGYHKRPELTREKFVRNPFSTKPDSRLYRTSDLARYLPDGQIEYLARTDQQVKIRGFRIELGEIEAALCRHPAIKESVVLAREDAPGDRRLVAYVVPTVGKEAFSTADLRSYLADTLPSHMIPSAFVLLKELPQTANGKVDRSALPAPEQNRAELNGSFVPARTVVEETLADIWAKVLKIDKVGVKDNFFELGGDSILSIQIVSRANQAGLKFTPKQLFQNQTIAGLAAVATVNSASAKNHEIVTGPVPLTPIQHWFFEQDLCEPHHFNQAAIVEVPNNLDFDLLENAWRVLIGHHDALRLRFTQDEGGWHQENVSSDDAAFSRIDLSMFGGEDQRISFEKNANELQRRLNLSSGPLARAALFKMGAQQPYRLLLVIHHLVVDAVSWPILFEDLECAYEQLSRAQAVALPGKSTSFKTWAERLTHYAQSAASQNETDYWISTASQDTQSIPVDFSLGDNTVASAATVTVQLNGKETQSLLQDVPGVYQTQINEVLLTALAEALRKWTSASSVLVDVEGHGREDILADVDLSRTVGWFTTISPLMLKVAELFDPGTALTSIKEQIRSVPNRGIGHGVLRYLGTEETKRKLRAGAQPQISFNYVGRIDPIAPRFGFLGSVNEFSGSLYSPRGKRRHLIEAIGSVTQGQLRMSFSYSSNRHQSKTIERLAQDFIETLRSIIHHCCSPEAGGFTASDFVGARMSQDDFNALIGKINK